MPAAEKKMTMGHMLLTAMIALGGGGAYMDTKAQMKTFGTAQLETVNVQIKAVTARVDHVEDIAANKEVVAVQLESVKTEISLLRGMMRDVKASQDDLKALLIQALAKGANK